MQRRYVIHALLAVLLYGCSGAGQPVAEHMPAAQPSAAPTLPPPTSTPAAKEVIDAQDVVAVPTDLNSYRTRLDIRLKGSQAGTPIDGTVRASQERVREPAAQRLTLTSEGELGDVTGGRLTSFELIQIGDQAWLKADDQWSTLPVVSPAQFEQGLLGPTELLADLKTARLAEPSAAVNGVPARRYHFVREDLEPSSALAEADGIEGDIWLNPEGGYVVQMRMRATGKNILGASGQPPFEGTVEFSYVLFDLDAPIAIDPPQ